MSKLTGKWGLYLSRNGLGIKKNETRLSTSRSSRKKQKTIHITGTNGKGSSVAFLTSIFKSSGLRAGAFISPHLINWNGRISVNGSPITNHVFFLAVSQILKKLKREVQLTIFEFLTVVSLYYFAEINPVDIVVYEVGLGGEHDATNVILPLVSVITNIDYDHFRYLGNKLEGIAEEKAGIIKLDVPCFTAEKHPKILALLRKKANEKRSKLIKIAWPKKFTFDNGFVMNFQFHFQKEIFDIKTKMIGHHQVKNICLVTEVAFYLKKIFPTITNDSIKKGIAETFWPNRLEIMNKKPLLLIDGAHNQAGAKVLTETITTLFSNKKPIFLVSIMKDKQVKKMLKIFQKIAYQIIFTEIPNLRKQTVDELRKNNTAKFRKISDCQKAFDYFYSLLNEETVGIVTGSLLFTAYIKKEFL